MLDWMGRKNDYYSRFSIFRLIDENSSSLLVAGAVIKIPSISGRRIKSFHERLIQSEDHML